MHAQQVAIDELDFSDALETIELELALQVQDVNTIGFDRALDAALGSLNGQILFRLPATMQEDALAVTAVSLPTGEDAERKLFLVTLDADGETMRVTDASAAESPVADLAQSMASVLAAFTASTAREEEAILL